MVFKSTTRTAMDFSQMYLMGEAFLRGVLRVEAIQDIPDPFTLLRAEFRPKERVVFRRAMGGAPADLIGTTHAALFLVSDKVKSALETHAVTGWTTYPIEIY